MRLSIEISGLDQAIQELRRREAAFNDAAPATMDLHGMGMMEQTAELSPFDTGFMASHVQYTPADDQLAFTVGWHRADFDAEGFAPYYFYQEFGTDQHRAQPSLGPTAHQSLPALEKDIARTLRRTMVEGR